jgi:hypothetical protein
VAVPFYIPVGAVAEEEGVEPLHTPVDEAVGAALPYISADEAVAEEGVEPPCKSADGVAGAALPCIPVGAVVAAAAAVLPKLPYSRPAEAVEEQESLCNRPVAEAEQESPYTPDTLAGAARAEVVKAAAEQEYP